MLLLTQILLHPKWHEFPMGCTDQSFVGGEHPDRHWLEILGQFKSVSWWVVCGKSKVITLAWRWAWRLLWIDEIIVVVLQAEDLWYWHLQTEGILTGSFGWLGDATAILATSTSFGKCHVRMWSSVCIPQPHRGFRFQDEGFYFRFFSLIPHLKV